MLQRAREEVHQAAAVDPYQQQLAAALALASDGDNAGADRALTSVMSDSRFGRLPAPDRHRALSVASEVAIRLDQYPRALELSRKAISIDGNNPDDWYRLSQLQRVGGEYDAATRALLRLIEGWPELLGNLEDSHIIQLVHMTDHTSQARLDLLQTLFDANWDRNGIGASNVWYELALMRVERGQLDAARSAIERIAWPMELVKLRMDKRFDPLIDASSSRFNVKSAARQQVEHLQRQASLNPSQLDTRMELSYAMLTAGMTEEALALSDTVLSAIADAPVDAPPFADMDQQIWLMNNRAIALRRLGRTDEALAELERASRMTESGGVNVSQSLNLGNFYCSLGRPGDALLAIAKVGNNMTGYGRMVQATVQLRAAVRKGDSTGASEALEYIRQHRQDSQTALLNALIETDRIDEAARAVIGLLASHTDRTDALEWLQEFRSAAPLPGDLQVRTRRDALVARRDVQDAVARVGRIEQYDIFGDNNID